MNIDLTQSARCFYGHDAKGVLHLCADVALSITPNRSIVLQVLRELSKGLRGNPAIPYVEKTLTKIDLTTNSYFDGEDSEGAWLRCADVARALTHDRDKLLQVLGDVAKGLPGDEVIRDFYTILAADGEFLELRSVMTHDCHAMTYLPAPDGWVRVKC